jgi:hypothetical protein
MTAPNFLLPIPEPRAVQRSFHGKKLLVWEGVMDVASIQGWVDNPRLDLELKTFKKNNLGRTPEQDEILAIMQANSDFKLATLAEDIRKNGVRTPIIISTDGTLLDGNRRFFAVKHLISVTPANDPQISDFRKIPVIVLDESCDKADEELVVVHENFYANLKLPWPELVLATYVYDALERGETAKSVAQRYEWTTAKVNETRRIMELIREFTIFATSELPDGLGLSEIEAERVAAERFQFFNEAQKSFYIPLQQDFSFKSQFFKWIYEGKFSSFQQVRIAWQAWGIDELRQELLTSNPEAAETVRAEIAYHQTGRSNKKTTHARISEFSEFLKELKASEIASLGEEDVQVLAEISSIVQRMAKSVQE